MKIKANNENYSIENLQRIVVYGEGVILYDNPEGYIEEYTIKDDKLNSMYPGRLNTLYLNNEIKKANKENLNRKDNYILKYKNTYAFNSGYALYIHKDEISVKYLGEKIAMQSKTETNYLNAYKFTFAAGAVRDVYNYERFEYDKNFTLPEGARWGSTMGTEAHPCYDSYNNRATGESGIIKRWATTETIKETITTKRGYCKTVYSEDEKKRREFVKIINDKKCFYKDISSYELEKLQQYFNITLKEI